MTECTIFWAGSGYRWHSGTAESEDFADIDGAITAAKARGFKIKKVAVTRGLLPHVPREEKRA